MSNSKADEYKSVNKGGIRMTNYEKIKNMTVAEMVMFIDCEGTCNYCVYANDDCKGLKCREGVKAWLNQEVEE